MKGTKTGGRTKGTPNRRTQELIEKAEELGVHPVEVLLRICAADWKGLGYDSSEIVKMTTDGGTFTEDRITLKDRLHAAKEAAQYLFPKLKAIEHSGSIEGQGASLVPVTKAALIDAIKNDPFIGITITEDGSGAREVAEDAGDGGPGHGSGSEEAQAGGGLGTEQA